MVYAIEPEIRIEVPGIAVSMEAANAFVSRLVMQTVFDVLERQGRSAGLPDAIILAILDQVTIQISYEPLGCKAVGDDKKLAAGSLQKAISNSDLLMMPYLETKVGYVRGKNLVRIGSMGNRWMNNKAYATDISWREPFSANDEGPVM
ncbi:hypothetical protein KIN20_029419 [Parelaphostrongylus tenuis]|uniref:Uncharacterized protein n=1 Tax=Parelaphostrongylus tenuis TaxID=148309 RepID=A0AAD5R2C1_PARTN|nr:hypothetical protein KIN20_029419 [Parelaphostrongylus tenuis]